jgi:hypothetical protein
MSDIRKLRTYRQIVGVKPQAGMRPALLTGTRPCPGRAGFQELRFDVGGLAWSWCHPDSADIVSSVLHSGVKALLLKPGAYGVAVEAVLIRYGVRSQGLGPAQAANFAKSGVPVFVHESLVR